MFNDRDDAARQLSVELARYGGKDTVVVGLARGGVVLAIPVASGEAIQQLRPEVDQLVCLQQPRFFQSVGQHYGRFPQVDDDEVVGLLERFSSSRGE